MIHPAKLAALALQQVAKVLDKLTEEQLNDLAEGRASVEFRSHDAVISSGRAKALTGAAPRKAAAPKTSVDIEAAAAAIRAMTTSDEVSAYLDANDRQFTGPVLKEIAIALGPTVSATGTKQALKGKIVAGTAGFRERSQAVFAGGWQN